MLMGKRRLEMGMDESKYPGGQAVDEQKGKREKD
jgi:hypothetical protein